MSNSSLVNYTKISPYKDKRKATIKKITIHHMAGNLTVEQCGNVFQSSNSSANYGIGSDGRVGLYVSEDYRSWASSNADNDHQAVTIEVANDVVGGNWHVSDKALAKLIDLCVDICKRNGIKKLNFTGDKNGNLTMHCYFVSTTCPGEYLKSKFKYIADEVNRRLNMDLRYQAHIQSYGWQEEKNNGQMAGSLGKSKRLEAIVINSDNANFTYQVHIQSYGDSYICKNGQVAGTIGIGKRLESIKIDCDKKIAYRVHCQTYGWTDWVTNGTWCGTKGESKRLEAIEIKFV